MKKATTFNLAYVLFAAMGVLFLHNLRVTTQTIAPIPYSDFQKYLKESKVKDVIGAAAGVPVDAEADSGSSRAEEGFRALRRSLKT